MITAKFGGQTFQKKSPGLGLWFVHVLCILQDTIKHIDFVNQFCVLTATWEFETSNKLVETPKNFEVSNFNKQIEDSTTN